MRRGRLEGGELVVVGDGEIGLEVNVRDRVILGGRRGGGCGDSLIDKVSLLFELGVERGVASEIILEMVDVQGLWDLGGGCGGG